MKKKKPQVELCEKCGINEAQEPHPCPYQHEINDVEDDEYCTCCEECEDDCRADI
jgi:hypothetical protein